MVGRNIQRCVYLLFTAYAPALALANESLDYARYDEAPGEETEIVLAQATQGNSNRPGYRTAARSGRTSRVPYMIGDSPLSSTGGLNGSLAFEGLDVASVEHPAFGGGRTNVAENNSVMPDDRLLFDYRHFHNATDTNVLGTTNSLDIERFIVGFEKSMFDGLISAQLSVPLVRQLNSDLQIYDDGSSAVNVPATDRHGELGNMAVALKTLLISRSRFAFSGGIAVNIPTADDTQITEYFANPDLVIDEGLGVSTTSPTNIFLNARIDNDTVNLVPFFAWSYRPTDRFFHQGFAQIDAPLNGSDARIQVNGEITPDGPPYTSSAFDVVQIGEVEQQTLMRLNLGFGYWLHQGSNYDVLRGIAGLFEVHYTSTLDDANPFVAPVTNLGALGTDMPISVSAGQLNDRVDQVNLSSGIAVDLGGLVITNGIIVPVSNEQERGFDCEYNCQINKRF